MTDYNNIKSAHINLLQVRLIWGATYLSTELIYAVRTREQCFFLLVFQLFSQQTKSDVLRCTPSQLCTSPELPRWGQLYPTHLACSCIIFELESSLWFDVYLKWMSWLQLLSINKSLFGFYLLYLKRSSCCFKEEKRSDQEDPWAHVALHLINVQVCINCRRLFNHVSIHFGLPLWWITNGPEHNNCLRYSFNICGNIRISAMTAFNWVFLENMILISSFLFFFLPCLHFKNSGI